MWPCLHPGGNWWAAGWATTASATFPPPTLVPTEAAKSSGRPSIDCGRINRILRLGQGELSRPPGVVRPFPGVELMDSSPISVVLPNYNHARYIGRQLMRCSPRAYGRSR